jgi:hypothetical protein
MIWRIVHSSLLSEVHKELEEVTHEICSSLLFRHFHGWVDISETAASSLIQQKELSTHNKIRCFRQKRLDGSYDKSWYVSLTDESFFMVLPQKVTAKILSNFNWCAYHYDQMHYISRDDVYDVYD